MKTPATELATHDLLGRPVTELERELLSVHRHLESLVQRADLSPCVDRGLRAAIAVTWQILNDLDLAPAAPERLGGTDLG